MQNISLSAALSRPEAGREVAERLANETIPAARQAGIQVVHTTWGVDEADLAGMDPNSFRAFALSADLIAMDNPTIGDDLGHICLEDGHAVAAGRMLIKGTWNAELWPPLHDSFMRSQETSRPDMRFHKIRLSGFYAHKPDLEDWLLQHGFRTLLFAGVNTDACVLISLQEANLAGFDTVLLEDVSSTPRGESSQEAVVALCEKAWGFLSRSEELYRSVHAKYGFIGED